MVARARKPRPSVPQQLLCNDRNSHDLSNDVLRTLGAPIVLSFHRLAYIKSGTGREQRSHSYQVSDNVSRAQGAQVPRSCFHRREGESEVRIDRTKPRRFPPQLDEYIPQMTDYSTFYADDDCVLDDSYADGWLQRKPCAPPCQGCTVVEVEKHAFSIGKRRKGSRVHTCRGATPQMVRQKFNTYVIVCLSYSTSRIASFLIPRDR